MGLQFLKDGESAQIDFRPKDGPGIVDKLGEALLGKEEPEKEAGG